MPQQLVVFGQPLWPWPAVPSGSPSHNPTAKQVPTLDRLMARSSSESAASCSSKSASISELCTQNCSHNTCDISASLGGKAFFCHGGGSLQPSSGSYDCQPPPSAFCALASPPGGPGKSRSILPFKAPHPRPSLKLQIIQNFQQLFVASIGGLLDVRILCVRAILAQAPLEHSQGVPGKMHEAVPSLTTRRGHRSTECFCLNLGV